MCFPRGFWNKEIHLVPSRDFCPSLALGHGLFTFSSSGSTQQVWGAGRGVTEGPRTLIVVSGCSGGTVTAGLEKGHGSLFCGAL